MVQWGHCLEKELGWDRKLDRHEAAHYGDTYVSSPALAIGSRPLEYWSLQ
jgi:hypothetical protein